MKNVFWLLILAIFINCTSNNRNKVIVVQPFGSFSNVEAKLVFKEIQKINPNVILRRNIPFPRNAYYKPRNRYREIGRASCRERVLLMV